jgi:hypothetical protein
MPSVHPKIPLPLPLQGIRPDVDDFHIPPDALRPASYNWLLRDGKIVTRPGVVTFANDPGTLIPLRVITYTDHNNTNRLVHSTTQRWFAYNTGTNQWDDISDAALLWNSATAQVEFRVFNSGGTAYLLGVNRLNTPRAWNSNPASDFTEFGGSAPVAGAIAICADRVLLGDLGVAGGGTQIDVSAFQDHTSGWGSVQTTTLVDTPGRIVAMSTCIAPIRPAPPAKQALYRYRKLYMLFLLGTENYTCSMAQPLRSTLPPIWCDYFLTKTLPRRNPKVTVLLTVTITH